MSAPAVSMLWERSDPSTELPRRFGLRDAAEAADALDDLLRTHWRLPLQGCDRILLSSANLLAWVTTPSGPLVIKASSWSAEFDRLGAIADIVAGLGDQGLPVAAPRRTTTGHARVLARTASGVPLSVLALPAVDGDLLDAGDPVSVRAAGELLARVHVALAASVPKLPAGPTRPSAVPSADVRPERLRASSTQRTLAPTAAHRLDALIEQLPDLDVPPGLVHGDIRGANVLTRDGRVTALLDWEELVLSHRVLDLAAGAVKLATRFHSWDPPPAGSRQHLVAGYRRVIELTGAEELWLEAAILAAGLGQIPAGADPAGWAQAVESGI